MDSDERVTALKKAYADIILNTAKEAAARVMISEKKAKRFEHELKVAKEEGLRMMLRIKQMMDAKVNEAELTALNQKRKIDELEAQLHEAEDIVRDLREELREVQSELEMVKRDKAQRMVKRDKAQRLEKSDIPTHGQLEINRLYTSHLAGFQKPELYSGSIYSHTVGHAFNDQSNSTHNGFRTSIYRGYSNGGSLDLPSIISRRKEPLFYKNGCTQRIRACQKARLDQGFSLPAGVNKTKDDIRVEEVEGGKVSCNLQRQENDNKNTLKTKLIEGNLNPNWSLINDRKGATNHLSNGRLSSRNMFGESTRIDQALPCLSKNSGIDDARINHDLSETSPRFLSRKGELSIHSKCAGNSGSCEKMVNFSTDQGGENRHARMTRDTAEQNMKCGERSDILDAENCSPSSIQLEPNKSDIHLPRKTINDRHFKYTFHRKRKRESLLNENESLENYMLEECVPVENNNIFDENCDLEKISSQINGTLKTSTPDTLTDPENNAFLRDAAEEQTSFINIPKSSTVIESPQDRRGLLHIANQLISMPEKVVSTVSPALAE